MALSIKQAKAQYRGDPGLFGFLGKVGKGLLDVGGAVLPGPLGSAARLGSRIFGGRGAEKTTGTSYSGSRSVRSLPPMALPVSIAAASAPRAMPGAGLSRGAAMPMSAQLPAPGIRGTLERAFRGGATGLVNSKGQPREPFGLLAEGRHVDRAGDRVGQVTPNQSA